MKECGNLINMFEVNTDMIEMEEFIRGLVEQE